MLAPSRNEEPHVIQDAEFDDARPAAGAAAVSPGRDEAFAGELILQVALELPDRDQHGGRR